MPTVSFCRVHRPGPAPGPGAANRVVLHPFLRVPSRHPLRQSSRGVPEAENASGACVITGTGQRMLRRPFPTASASPKDLGPEKCSNALGKFPVYHTMSPGAYALNRYRRAEQADPRRQSLPLRGSPLRSHLKRVSPWSHGGGPRACCFVRMGGLAASCARLDSL